MEKQLSRNIYWRQTGLRKTLIVQNEAQLDNKIFTVGFTEVNYLKNFKARVQMRI